MGTDNPRLTFADKLYDAIARAEKLLNNEAAVGILFHMRGDGGGLPKIFNPPRRVGLRLYVPPASRKRYMDAQAILAIIEKRKDKFRDAASIGTGADTLVASAAPVAWDIAEEYVSLLY